MNDPIVLPVATSAHGLELVETLARRGLAATLVSGSAGWQVEIPARADHRAMLLGAVSEALADVSPSVSAPQAAEGTGAVVRELPLPRSRVTPPLRAA